MFLQSSKFVHLVLKDGTQEYTVRKNLNFRKEILAKIRQQTVCQHESKVL